MQMGGTNLGLLFVGVLTPRLIPAARRRRNEYGIADLGDKGGQKLGSTISLLSKSVTTPL
jgi:hypothetical protein